jgi:hypothetical protein
VAQPFRLVIGRNQMILCKSHNRYPNAISFWGRGLRLQSPTSPLPKFLSFTDDREMVLWSANFCLHSPAQLSLQDAARLTYPFGFDPCTMVAPRRHLSTQVWNNFIWLIILAPYWAFQDMFLERCNIQRPDLILKVSENFKFMVYRSLNTYRRIAHVTCIHSIRFMLPSLSW